jgi:hypothetical protein
MSETFNADSARDPRKRLQPFLDCVAHLLAKRWLREQRQQEEVSPDRQAPPAEEQQK